MEEITETSGLDPASQDHLEALWVLALTTGCRVSELLGLEVSDYDKAKGTLAIRRSVFNGAVGSTKSKKGKRTIKKGKRTIKLPQLSQDSLNRHIKQNEPAMWMFPNRKGKPIGYSCFLAFHWKPLLQSTGVPYKKFHTCRHYVGSTLLGKGLPITAVARFMGHDERTLLRTYSHLMPDQMDTVAAAMDDALG